MVRVTLSLNSHQRGIDKANDLGRFGKEVLKEGSNLKLKVFEEAVKEVVEKKSEE